MYIKNGMVKALTLMEVLIALVIIGILVLMVLPNHSNTISKAKAVEAKLQLEHAYNLQRENFYSRSKYSADLEELGFEQEKLATSGGSANYLIEIVKANSNSFIVRATSVVDFDQDGVFNIWEMDQDKNLREIEKD